MNERQKEIMDSLVIRFQGGQKKDRDLTKRQQDILRALINEFLEGDIS